MKRNVNIKSMKYEDFNDNEDLRHKLLWHRIHGDRRRPL